MEQQEQRPTPQDNLERCRAMAPALIEVLERWAPHNPAVSNVLTMLMVDPQSFNATLPELLEMLLSTHHAMMTAEQPQTLEVQFEQGTPPILGAPMLSPLPDAPTVQPYPNYSQEETNRVIGDE